MSSIPALQRQTEEHELDRLVLRVSKIVHDISGIQLGDKQASMVRSRLQKRMLELQIRDAKTYLEYLEGHMQSESAALVSILTTHHTYFFREFDHFTFLQNKGLSRVAEAAKQEGRRHLKIWSMACSRGQEVYSLAMFLNHHLPKIAPGFTYEILGTDIDPVSVDIAKNGVYLWNELKEVPLLYLNKNWARGTGEIAAYARANKALKSVCKFATHNLLELSESSIREKYDIIFCRNVFIYFKPDQIKRITSSILKNLNHDGLLFIGVSETLNGLGLELSSPGPSIYTPKRMSDLPAKDSSLAERTSATPSRLKVLCVDDSPTVLTLLGKILDPKFGFEVVATAKNGIEAAKALKDHRVDLVTLDIHMPEQDGLSYLLKNFSSQHPPVVVISSVAREDADLALNCLKAGASDYVEKPALANLDERSEEIRLKLHSAFHSKELRDSGNVIQLETAFAKKVAFRRPETKLRIMVMSLADQRRVIPVLKDMSAGDQPPIVIIGEGMGNATMVLATEIKNSTQLKVTEITHGKEKLNINEVYVGDAKLLANIIEQNTVLTTSIMVFGEITDRLAKKFQDMAKKNILIEEMKIKRKNTLIEKIADDKFPTTSFAYVSNLFFSKQD